MKLPLTKVLAASRHEEALKAAGESIALAEEACSPMDAARAGDAPAHVAEIVRFRLADGVSDAAFLDATRAMQPIVASATGSLSRSLSKNEDGSWTDYVVWKDLARAQAAAETIFAEPATKPFMDAIDGASVDMRHEPILWQME